MGGATSSVRDVRTVPHPMRFRSLELQEIVDVVC